MKSYDDCCNTCHELERDLINARNRNQYDEILVQYKEHIERTTIERKNYLYFIRET